MSAAVQTRFGDDAARERIRIIYDLHEELRVAGQQKLLWSPAICSDGHDDQVG